MLILYHTHTEEPLVCEDGDVRLVDGATPYEGRVEICLNNQLGSVCSNEWSFKDALVLCRQAGFPGAGMLLIYKLYLANIRPF